MRRSFWPTTLTSRAAPGAGRGKGSLTSSTRPAGFDTAVNTSTLASALGRTNTVTGAVLRPAASRASTVTRTKEATSPIASPTE